MKPGDIVGCIFALVFLVLLLIPFLGIGLCLIRDLIDTYNELFGGGKNDARG